MTKDPGKEDLEGQDSFLEIEKNFHNVINEIMQDKSLEKFRNSYEELHNALVLSQEHNATLVDKCSTLNHDILINAEKIAQVLKLSQEDQKTINNLRNEFERAWEIITKSEENDRRSSIIIENLKAETLRLSHLVEETKSFSLHADISVQDVTTEIDILKNEIKMNEQKMKTLREKIDQMQTEGSSMVGNIKENQEELQNLLTDLNSQSAILNNNQEVFETTNRDSKSIHEDIQVKTKIIKENLRKIEEVQETIEKKKEMVIRLAKDLDNTEYERFLIHKRIHKNKISLRMARKKTTDVQKQFGEQKKYFDTQDLISKTFPKDLKELNNEKKELLNDQNEIQRYHKEIQQVRNEYRAAFKQNKEVLNQGKIVGLELGMEIKATQAVADKEQYDLGKIQDQIDNQKIIKDSESQRIHKAELEKLKYKQEQFADQKYSQNLENEALKMKFKSSQDKKLGNQLMQDNRDREKQIDEGIKKYKLLGDDLKTVSSQAQTTSNDILSLENEIVNLNKERENVLMDMHILHEDMNRIKGHITDVDLKIAKEHLTRLKTENNIIELTNEIEQLNQAIEEQNRKIDDLLADLEQKRMILDMAFTSMDEMKRTISNVGNVMGSLHLQLYNVEKPLVKTREEVNLTVAKLKARQKAYDIKVDEISELKNSLMKEVERKNALEWKVVQCNKLRKETVQMEAEYEYQKKLSAALEIEMSQPRLIHSTTMMESTDPEKFAMIKMKHSIIADSWAKSRQFVKLKDQLAQIKKEYEKIQKHFVQCRVDPATEIDTLNNELKLKTRDLMKKEEKLMNEQPYLIERESEVQSAREQLRNERIINSQISYRKMRAETVNTPKLPTLKLPRVETLFIGGGFALASPHVPTIPQVPYSARMKMNKKLVPIKQPTTPRNNNFTPKAKLIKPFIFDTPQLKI